MDTDQENTKFTRLEALKRTVDGAFIEDSLYSIAGQVVIGAWLHYYGSAGTVDHGAISALYEIGRPVARILLRQDPEEARQQAACRDEGFAVISNPWPWWGRSAAALITARPQTYEIMHGDSSDATSFHTNTRK